MNANALYTCGVCAYLYHTITIYPYMRRSYSHRGYILLCEKNMESI